MTDESGQVVRLSVVLCVCAVGLADPGQSYKKGGGLNAPEVGTIPVRVLFFCTFVNIKSMHCLLYMHACIYVVIQDIVCVCVCVCVCEVSLVRA